MTQRPPQPKSLEARLARIERFAVGGYAATVSLGLLIGLVRPFAVANDGQDRASVIKLVFLQDPLESESISAPVRLGFAGLLICTLLLIALVLRAAALGTLTQRVCVFGRWLVGLVIVGSLIVLLIAFILTRDPEPEDSRWGILVLLFATCAVLPLLRDDAADLVSPNVGKPRY